ncbi:MAG: hypothetical protein DMF50_02145 [Acidobacteria bacterium]|nr:MAG: hypothetical protein DMF50_02145 [Acidobacteriota bacterium]
MKIRPLKRGLDLREDLGWIAGVLGALLLLNAGFYLLLNRPRLRALEELQSGGNEVRRALKLQSERCETMRDLVRRYDEETERLADFYAHRLGTQAERMTSIQKEIRAIAEEFRIDPEAVDFTTEAMQGTGLTRFQISFPLTGGYPNLRQFISRVEKSDHLLIVDEVQLTGAKEGGAMLSLTIRISTYFRPPEGEVQPPPRRA